MNRQQYKMITGNYSASQSDEIMRLFSLSQWSFIDGIVNNLVFHVMRDDLDIQDILGRIQNLEWDAILSEAREKREQARLKQEQEYLKWLELKQPCSRCRKETKNKDLQILDVGKISADIPSFSNDIPKGVFCKSCYEEVEEIVFSLYQRECLICGVSFFAKRAYISNPLCEKHNTEQIRREMLRVNSQNSRTRSLGLADDLTLNEWLEIIQNHGNRCHYCGGLWSDMEHVVPVAKGGGTTKTNVVPSCHPCNMKKARQDFSMQGAMAI